MTPSEVRAAALRQIKWASMDHCDYVIEEHDDPDGLQRIEDAEATAEHIIATVPADGDDAITVELLERWGGVARDWGVIDRMTFYRDDALPLSLIPVADGRKIVIEHSERGWTTIVRGITSAADLRQLLKLLGCKLKGAT